MNKQKKFVLKNPFDLKRFKSGLKNKKILAVILLFALLLIAVAVYIIISSNSNGREQNATTLDRNKITELSKSNNCQDSVNQLRYVQPNEQDIDGSIALLSYRGTCYYQLDKYQDALGDYESLKVYYDKKGDTYNAGETASLIVDIKERIVSPKPKNPGPKTRDSDQMSPEFRQELEAAGAL